ncbi:MAG: hypothetical protein IKP73_09585 [Bacteroidales bacterium]|nr:hypothetical protein [Bacteroidales bacterium]
MKFCILIELTRNTISFRYYRSDGDDKFLSLGKDGKQSSCALPLTIWCNGTKFEIGDVAVDAHRRGCQDVYCDIFDVSKECMSFVLGGEQYPINKLLLMAIEDYIDRVFFQKIMFNTLGSLAAHRSSIPLILMFHADINYSERLFVRTQFQNAGYCNFDILDYNSELIKVLQIDKIQSDTLSDSMVISDNGKNTYIGVYNSQCNCKMVRIFEGLGKDPRIIAAADMLWNSMPPNWHDRQKENEILLRVATEFIESGRKEFNDYIELSNGEKFCAVASLRDISNVNITNSALNNVVAEVVQSSKIQPENSIIILCGKTISGYAQFIRTNWRFRKTYVMHNDDTSRISDCILKTVKNNDFKVMNQTELKSVVQVVEDVNVNTKKVVAEDVNKDIKPKVEISQGSTPKPSRREIREKIVEAKQHLKNGDKDKAEKIYDEIVGFVGDYPEIESLKELLTIPELSEKEIVAAMREIRELTATKHFDDAITKAMELLTQLPKNSSRLNEVRILLDKAKEKKQNKNINNKSQKNGKI